MKDRCHDEEMAEPFNEDTACEQAVRTYIFERAVEEAKAATAGMDEAELNDLIDEAVQWAREH